jgi:hypothetical protein
MRCVSGQSIIVSAGSLFVGELSGIDTTVRLYFSCINTLGERKFSCKGVAGTVTLLERPPLRGARASLAATPMQNRRRLRTSSERRRSVPR